MAELSAGSGLESAAVRGRGGWGEFVAAVKERLSKRRTAVSSPKASVTQETVVLHADDEQVVLETTPAVLETAILEAEDQIPETGADEAALEFKRQLEELNREFVLAQVRDALLPEKAESPIGIFGKELSPEAKAAFLALRAELVKPAAEAGAEDASAEDAQVTLSEEGEAAYALLVAELRAKLAPVAETAPEVSGDVVEREAITSVPVTHFEDDEAGTSQEEGAGMTETLELRDVAAETHGENDVTKGGVEAREVLEGIVESGKGVGEITPALAQGELTREDAAGATEAGAGDNHEVIAVAETGDALVVVPEGDGALEDGRTEGEGENA